MLKVIVNNANSIAANALNAEQQAQLRSIIEQGLPIEERPFLAIAQQLNASEQSVINTITAWQKQGLIKRFGLVVKHRNLGYTANAMVVFNIPNEQIERVGNLLSAETAVTLCYQRPKVLPDWPYNLFCMIHGKNRDQVLAQLADICATHQLEHFDKSILFSNKAYKQQGGRYQKPAPAINSQFIKQTHH
jgi:DNA-binding Lrp family transcriptional regulator